MLNVDLIFIFIIISLYYIIIFSFILFFFHENRTVSKQLKCSVPEKINILLLIHCRLSVQKFIIIIGFQMNV